MTPRPGLPAGSNDHVMAGASEADAGVLSQVIADAFFGLAVSQWLVSDPGARQEIFPGYFRLYVEHALASGIIHITPGRTAVALWLPARDEPAAMPDDYEARLAAITGSWISRFEDFDAALGRHHPAGIAHHHLAILAVRPDRQRRGIGTALLRAHHAALDRDGIPAYLEASGLDTRGIYRRHCYTGYGAPVQLPGGPRMYPMVRPPHHSDPASPVHGPAPETTGGVPLNSTDDPAVR